MDTEKIPERKVLTPFEVAKDMIRGAIHKKDCLDLKVSSNLSKLTLDSSAHVDAKSRKIVVTSIYGVEICEEFPIHEIIKVILRDTMGKLTSDSEVINHRNKQKSHF